MLPSAGAHVLARERARKRACGEREFFNSAGLLETPYETPKDSWLIPFLQAAVAPFGNFRITLSTFRSSAAVFGSLLGVEGAVAMLSRWEDPRMEVAYWRSDSHSLRAASAARAGVPSGSLDAMSEQLAPYAGPPPSAQALLAVRSLPAGFGQMLALGELVVESAIGTRLPPRNQRVGKELIRFIVAGLIARARAGTLESQVPRASAVATAATAAMLPAATAAAALDLVAVPGGAASAAVSAGVAAAAAAATATVATSSGYGVCARVVVPWLAAAVVRVLLACGFSLAPSFLAGVSLSVAVLAALRYLGKLPRPRTLSLARTRCQQTPPAPRRCRRASCFCPFLW